MKYKKKKRKLRHFLAYFQLVYKKNVAKKFEILL